MDSKILVFFKNEPMYELSEDLEHSIILNYIPRWPLFVFLCSAMFCLGCSATFHLFHIENKAINDMLNRLDYGGISVLIMGSSYPAIFYTYACKKAHYTRNCMLALITITSTLSFLGSLHPQFN